MDLEEEMTGLPLDRMWDDRHQGPRLQAEPLEGHADVNGAQEVTVGNAGWAAGCLGWGSG